MRAILIEPTTRTVSEVEYNGDYRHIYELIHCKTFDVVKLNADNDLFVDDEGLLTNGPNPDGYFAWLRENGAPYGPLAGKGLILGIDNNSGESIATDMDIQEARRRVLFAMNLPW